MNRKLKFALKSCSSEQGFAIPTVVGVGLVLTLVGVTMIVRSQGEQVTTLAQKQTAQSLATSETGITRLQAFLNKYPDFAKFPSTQWNDASVIERAANTYIQTVRCVTAPTLDSVKTDIKNDLASLLPGWKSVDVKDSNKGQFRLQNYIYDAPSGILTIDGKNNQGAFTTLQVIIPIQEVIPTGRQPAVPPGLWLSFSDLTKNQTVKGNLLLNGCNDDNTNPTNSDGTPSPTRASDIETSVPPGSFYVNSLTIFPRLPPLPSVAPAKLPANLTQNYYIDRYNPDSGSAASLPPELPTTDDIKNYPSGTQKDGSYAYRLSSITSDSIKSAKGKLTIASGKNVTIYLTGNIDLKGNDIVGDPTAPNRLEIFGSQDGAYCPNFPSTKDLPSGTDAGCNTNLINLNGTPEINAYIFAPGATAGLEGGGQPINNRFHGAFWVKKWAMDSKSEKTAVTQTISSWNEFDWDDAWTTTQISPISKWQRQEASP